MTMDLLLRKCTEKDVSIKPMFKVKYDDVGAYDLLFPSCSKEIYDFFYQNEEGHSNCLDNLNTAFGTSRTIIHPVNLFMNTRIGTDSKIVCSNSAYRMEELKPNHIMIADEKLLDEVY